MARRERREVKLYPTTMRVPLPRLPFRRAARSHAHAHYFRAQGIPTRPFASVPATHRVARCAAGKGASDFSIDTESVPAPGPGEVLVKVAAIGVNRPDIVQRMGMYPPPAGHSDVLGLEVSGEVVSAGPDLEFEEAQWSPPPSSLVGTEVTALANGGGYAEYCVVPASQALPVPRSLSVVESAALP